MAAPTAAMRSTGKTCGPSPQKTAETQARILEAALARFLSDGFERTRMLDVARDAGLAKGTLYEFRSGHAVVVISPD